jgi:hypothetical protein
VWLKRRRLTLTRVTTPERPETAIDDGYGDAGTSSGMAIGVGLPKV